jgi:hypothetical protein
MRSDRVFESRSAVRVAIIFVSVGLHGCVPLMSPRNFGDWTIYRMPSYPALTGEIWITNWFHADF